MKGFRQRTEKDLEQLVPLIKTIQFFVEREIKDHDYTEIVSCLTYEYFKAGDIVFDYGKSTVTFTLNFNSSDRLLWRQVLYYFLRHCWRLGSNSREKGFTVFNRRLTAQN